MDALQALFGGVHPGYRIRPEAGEKHLDAAEVVRRLENYLFDELAQRLFRETARFRLLVQFADDGDPVEDGSLSWPEERSEVELGTPSITSRVTDSAVTERQMIFDPPRLVGGIELSGDPLPAARSAVYAISYRCRNA